MVFFDPKIFLKTIKEKMRIIHKPLDAFAKFDWKNKVWRKVEYKFNPRRLRWEFYRWGRIISKSEAVRLREIGIYENLRRYIRETKPDITKKEEDRILEMYHEIKEREGWERANQFLHEEMNWT